MTAEETEAIVRLTQEAAEQLWSVCENQGLVSQRTAAGLEAERYEQPRHFRSVFSSSADCQRLRNGLLAMMAGGGAAGTAAQAQPVPPQGRDRV